MKIFVTGFHRAGTHSTAEHFANKYGLAYITEKNIHFDNFKLAAMLPDNSCIQCPGLAHRVEDLYKLGKVIWCVRDELEVITSMRNAEINQMAWHITRGFHKQYPDDEIWNQLEYDGSIDMHNGFIRYYKLLIKLKNHFYETKFKTLCELSNLSDLPKYDNTMSSAFKRPLREAELRHLFEDCLTKEQRVKEIEYHKGILDGSISVDRRRSYYRRWDKGVIGGNWRPSTLDEIKEDSKKALERYLDAS